MTDYNEHDKEVIEDLWSVLLNFTDEYDACWPVRELIKELFDRVDDFKAEMDDGYE